MNLTRFDIEQVKPEVLEGLEKIAAIRLVQAARKLLMDRSGRKSSGRLQAFACVSPRQRQR